MAELVTLELSEEAARWAAERARRTGRRLEEVLTAWIEQGARSDATADTRADYGYALFTPYGNETAAQTLLDVLDAAETAGDQHTATP